MVEPKNVVRWLLRNLLLAAVGFLPLFLLSNLAELKLRGVEFSEPVSYHASGAIVLYLGLFLPTLLGVIAHSGTLSLVQSRASARTQRVATIALAPLVPFTMILSGLAPYLSDFPGSTVMASLLYGLGCAMRVEAGEGEVPRE